MQFFFGLVAGLTPDTNRRRSIHTALVEGAKNSVLIIVVCAAVGLVVGTFTLTGLALSIGKHN